jgi:hypothetical protein
MERDSSGVERQHELLTNIRGKSHFACCLRHAMQGRFLTLSAADEEKDAFDAEWEAQARGIGIGGARASSFASSSAPRTQRTQQRQIGYGGMGGR